MDISPVSVSPGADAMRHFLTAMEQIHLGSEQLQRATARKMVDEQLQSVVKVKTLKYYNCL